MGGSVNASSSPNLPTRSSSSPIFTKGSRVEVSSEEEGFTGAWYPATVIDPNPRSGSSKKKRRIVYVEYQTLLAEDDNGNSSKPLREHVKIELIRPPPPTEPAKLQFFELNDVVDAFYKDGWWTGVITGVLGNSKFAVTFQNPSELIVFGASELRVHRDWVRGEWIRPQKQITGFLFSEGKKVEVSVEKQEYRDVWFPATLQEEIRNGSFLVEYQSTRINGVSKSVKEVVNLLHIRPLPPHLEVKKFVLLEKVEAYFDFGWWSGVITKELADSRYIVFFKSINEERELNHSEIRPQIEWKDGSWFSASQATKSNCRGLIKDICHDAHHTGRADSVGRLGAVNYIFEERIAGSIDSMENQTEQSTSCNKEPSTVMTTQKQTTKQPTSDIDNQHSRPLKKMKEANMNEAPSLSKGQLTISMGTPSEDTNDVQVGLNISANGNSGINNSDKSRVGDLLSIKADNFSRVKKARSQRQKPVEFGSYTSDFLRRKVERLSKLPLCSSQALIGDKTPGDLDNLTPEALKKKGGRLPISLMSSTKTSVREIRGDAAGCVAVQNDCANEVTPITLDLNCEVIEDKQAKELCQNPHEESPMACEDQIHDLVAYEIKVGSQLEVGRESILKRKRGRPRKNLSTSPDVSVGANQPNGGVADIVLKELSSDKVGLPATERQKRTEVEGSESVKKYMKHGVDKAIPNVSDRMKSNSSETTAPLVKKDKLHIRKVVLALAKQHDQHSVKRGRKRTISLNAESHIQGDLFVEKKVDSFVKDGLTKEAEMTTIQLPCSMSDDQPLSMFFKEKQSTKTVDASGTGRTVEQYTEVNGSQKDIVVYPLVIDAAGTMSDKDPRLSFVKNSPLWRAIESQEVFEKMPQNPHFRPLEKHKESSREGLAIGLMVNFCSVVDKTSVLQFHDPRSVIEDNLETLHELESHGFDVKVLRNRLTRLLLMKDKFEKFQYQTKESKNQIEEIYQDRRKIDERINAIDNQMHLLQEERALVLSEKDKKDTVIASLESAVKDANDKIMSVRLEFDALVASPW